MVLVEPGEEARLLAPDGQGQAPLLGDGLDRLLQEGLQFLHHQDLLQTLEEIADEVFGEGIGEAQFQNLDLSGQPQFLHRIGHVGPADAAGDDPPAALAADPVEGAGLCQGAGPGLVLQQPGVGHPGHRRHHHLFKGVLFEAARPRPGSEFTQGHRPPGVVHPGGGAQQHRQPQLFREGKGRQGHLLGLPGAVRLQHGEAGHFGVIAIVLFVLAGKEGRIVGADDDHAALDPHVSQGHEGVGGHVEAHVLHGGEHSPAAGRGPGGHLQGHLLIDRIFEAQVGLARDLVAPVADFRGRGAGIGGDQGHPGLQGAADDGLIAQKQASLSRFSLQ